MMFFKNKSQGFVWRTGTALFASLLFFTQYLVIFVFVGVNPIYIIPFTAYGMLIEVTIVVCCYATIITELSSDRVAFLNDKDHTMLTEGAHFHPFRSLYELPSPRNEKQYTHHDSERLFLGLQSYESPCIRRVATKFGHYKLKYEARFLIEQPRNFVFCKENPYSTMETMTLNYIIELLNSNESPSKCKVHHRSLNARLVSLGIVVKHLQVIDLWKEIKKETV